LELPKIRTRPSEICSVTAVTDESYRREFVGEILEEIPAPDVDADGPTQLLVTMTTLDEYKGKIVLGRTGFLAGSWAFTDLCVGNVIRFAGVSIRDAVDMASAQPRKLLGLPPQRLQVGDPAELMLFDWEEGGEFRVISVC